MLRENAVLKFLNIDGIAIGDDGAANIADALTTNETLEELHMVTAHNGTSVACLLACLLAQTDLPLCTSPSRLALESFASSC